MVTALKLELAIQNPAGALVANHDSVRANRVELCTALKDCGGITPSAAMIEAVVAATPIPVHVLIRCRPGPFCFTTDEVAVMVRDAALAIRAGAAGVVIGALNVHGAIDVDAMRQISEAAWLVDPNASITCHRAMDVAIGAGFAEAAVEALVQLGVGRVLTSGGAPRSIAGAPVLAQLATQAGGRLEIMAGGGVRPGDVASLAAAGVDAVHLSAGSLIGQAGVGAGPGGGSEAGIEVTDLTKAAAMAQAVAVINQVG